MDESLFSLAFAINQISHTKSKIYLPMMKCSFADHYFHLKIVSGLGQTVLGILTFPQYLIN